MTHDQEVIRKYLLNFLEIERLANEIQLRLPSTEDKPNLNTIHDKIVEILQLARITVEVTAGKSLVYAYLYPDLESKKAYCEAIAKGEVITAGVPTPKKTLLIGDGIWPFEGPHHPKANMPHRFHGQATIENGIVIKIK